MLPTDRSAPHSPRPLLGLTGCAMLASLTLTSLTLGCVPPDEPHLLASDAPPWDLAEAPLPNQPGSDQPDPPDDPYLEPLPDDFDVLLLDEEFVVRLDWSLMTDQRVRESESVDLELIYCLSPFAQTFHGPDSLGCVSWRTYTNGWAINGDLFDVHTGESSTRHGIPEQVGHAILPGQRTHVGVHYKSGAYAARAFVTIYHHGELIWTGIQVLTGPGQTWYAHVIDWYPQPPFVAFEPIGCQINDDQSCTRHGNYVNEVDLFLTGGQPDDEEFGR